MLYLHPKEEGVLDLLDVVDRKLRGWRIERMCSFGFNRSLHALTNKVPQIVRYARTFVHGDHHPYLVCFPDDEDALFTFQLVEKKLRDLAQPVRQELSYVNRKHGLAISLGGIDTRKITAHNREEVCPRAGRILTAEAYERIVAIDPSAFLKALHYELPADFSV